MSETTLLLIGLSLIFIGLVIALATIGVLTSEKQAVGRSLAAVKAINAAPSAMRQELNRPFSERVITPTFSKLTQIGRRLAGADQSDRLRRRLDLAGNPPGWDVDRIVAFKVLGLITGLVIGVIIPLAFGGNVLAIIGCAVVFAGAGFMTPNMILYQIAYNRNERMRKELPDALDLLTISVEAGLSFDSAVAQVARNSTGPIADEFFRVLQEMQIGVSRRDAITALGQRTDLAELRQFTSAMTQADAFGIPIANVLRVQAREMRIKRSQRAEEQAQKVPVKILFPLIFCILPTLFIPILGPAAIQIYQQLAHT